MAGYFTDSDPHFDCIEDPERLCDSHGCKRVILEIDENYREGEYLCEEHLAEWEQIDKSIWCSGCGKEWGGVDSKDPGFIAGEWFCWYCLRPAKAAS